MILRVWHYTHTHTHTHLFRAVICYFVGFGVVDTLSRAFAVVLLKIVGYIVRHVQRGRAPLVAVGIVRLKREAATSQRILGFRVWGLGFGVERWDEGRWDIPKRESLCRKSFILSTIMPPFYEP